MKAETPPADPRDLPAVLDVRWMSRALGRTRQHIAALIRDGRLPAHKLAGTGAYYISRERFLAWVDGVAPEDDA